VAEKLKEIFKDIGKKVKEVLDRLRGKQEKDYRQRIIEMTGKDPFKCPNCGEEMML